MAKTGIIRKIIKNALYSGFAHIIMNPVEGSVSHEHFGRTDSSGAENAKTEDESNGIRRISGRYE